MVPQRIQFLVCCWVYAISIAGSSLAHDAQLQLSVVDAGTDQPVPCRIHLKDAAGNPVQPKGLPFWHDHFVCPGMADLELAPGQYTYEIDRGPEYLLVTGKVAVAGTRTQSLTNRLTCLVNMSNEGWWSGETHVHRPLAEIELPMRAEDLRVAPVITWWNEQNPWRNRPIPADPLSGLTGTGSTI
jgi:hypothetical protein